MNKRLFSPMDKQLAIPVSCGSRCGYSKPSIHIYLPLALAENAFPQWYTHSTMDASSLRFTLNPMLHRSHVFTESSSLGRDPPSLSGMSTIYPHLRIWSRDMTYDSSCPAVSRSAFSFLRSSARLARSPSVPTDGCDALLGFGRCFSVAMEVITAYARTRRYNSSGCPSKMVSDPAGTYIAVGELVRLVIDLIFMPESML